MAKVLKLRGGNTAENSTFIGAAKELSVNTDTWSLRVHDGATPGGIEVGAGITKVSGNVVIPDSAVVNGNMTADKYNQSASYAPTNPVGTVGDRTGDFSFSNNYMYYCTGNYDGVTPIWVRTQMTTW